MFPYCAHGAIGEKLTAWSDGVNDHGSGETTKLWPESGLERSKSHELTTMSRFHVHIYGVCFLFIIKQIMDMHVGRNLI